MKSTDIKNHKTSISQTHNLEVLGSSPSWSTNKKALANSMQVLFYPMAKRASPLCTFG